MSDLEVSTPPAFARNDRWRWTTRRQPGPALSALAALLDRSLVQIVEAAADARSFDRQKIYTITDVWDNNTFPLFRAATGRTHRERERRAFAALSWMADFGQERRAWMLEEAAVAGHALDELLPAAGTSPPLRNYRGHVIAPASRVTPDLVEELGADYDLATATVRFLRVEREGTSLSAHLELAVARAYPTGEDPPPAPAELNIRLDRISEVRFDSQDLQGVALRSKPDGIMVDLGERGTVHAASADLRPEDDLWHLSAAGRRADAVVPPRNAQSRPVPKNGRLDGVTKATAQLFHHAMLEIRLVRYAEYADRVPIQDFCRAFDGAGQAILAAGAQRGRGRREAAFRDLIEEWATRGGPRLARWFSDVLRKMADRPDLIPSNLAEAQPPAASPFRGRSLDQEVEAELRLAEYTAAHIRYGSAREASAGVHLALPPREGEGPWRLRALKSTTPIHFQLETHAFAGTNRPVLVEGVDLHEFALHDGAFSLTSRDGWSRESA